MNALRYLVVLLSAATLFLRAGMAGAGLQSVWNVSTGACSEATLADTLSGRASLRGAAPRNGSADPGHDPHGLESSGNQFWFAVSADMRQFSGPGEYDTQQYFRGACQAIAALGAGAFMVSPGDIDPPADAEWTIKQSLGQDFIWYPVVGNHESETPEDMAWLRSYDYDINGATPPNIVGFGPAGCQETTYSFDYGNSHFVVLNQYYDGTNDTGTNGDVVDALYTWLAEDLAATTKEHIFVFGHEPAYPQPDADNGRLRHLTDSLNQHPINRDRFWDLLKDEGVIAYFCGHTHNYSAVEIGGVWQLDVGHARGKGDTGARSTFVLIHVEDDLVRFESYRDDANGGPYVLDQRDILSQPAACPTFLDGVPTGTVESGLLNEISGLAVSRNNTNVLWVHNDSGDSPRIYALSSQGKLLATCNLVGASAIDWEDMAIGPGPTPGQDYIYISDTGDNARRRSSVTVYRVAESLVNVSQEPVTLSLNGVDAFPMQYPGTVYDSETLLVDPVSDDIFLVTRDRERVGAAYVYRNPSPHTPGVVVTLELVATIPLKGGDVSPSGDAVLLRPHSYSGDEDGYYWSRATGTNLWEAFSDTSCVVPLVEEPQGEALGFAADGLGYYTISEGSYWPIYFYEKDRTTLLVPAGSTWRYLDDGFDPGAAWRQIDYDDSAWAVGAAQLGYGDGDEATVVSYGHDPDDKHITTYFRHTFCAANASVLDSLGLFVLRDDGAVVYLNGAEIYRANLPAGDIQHETLASSTVGGNEESTFFPVSVDTLLLTAGLNVLAVEIHQAAVTSSDISFDLELLGTESPLATQVQVPMVPGWNLVSASLSPSTTMLTNALCGIEGKYDLVYAYDASDALDSWKRYGVKAPPSRTT